MKLGLAAALVTLLAACAGETSSPVEPVDEGVPAVPDSPGDGGEAAEKPAGAGQAGTASKSVGASSAPGGASDQDAVERTVATGALNVRSAPAMTGDVVRVLKAGDHVKPISCQKGWCKLAEGEYVGEKNLK